MRAQRGLALIAVLWLLALLTLLASAAAGLSVSRQRATARLGETIQTDAVLDSAIRVTLLELAFADGSGRYAGAGEGQSKGVLNRATKITIERDLGRVDLNDADRNMLFALFAGNGWPEDDARAMVARIEDWRDPDDTQRKDGAEVAQYRTAHLDYGPRNAAFESVDELRQVLGGDRVSREILDGMTVYSHGPMPLESATGPVVQNALNWADERKLGGHQWRREAVAVSSGAGSGASGSSAQNHSASLVGEVVRVTACQPQGVNKHCRAAVVRLTGHVRRPFSILEWRTSFTS